MGPRNLARALRSQPLRHLLRALFWGLTIFLAAAVVNVIGIRIVGDVNGWAHWLQTHRGEFLAWRLLLYGGTAWGWWWMRERLRRREPGAHIRLLRVEMAAILVILAMEAVAFLQP